MDEDIIKIEKFLERLPKPIFEKGKKMVVRRHLVNQISEIKSGVFGGALNEVLGETLILDAARESVSRISLSYSTKARMKERIISYVSAAKQQKFFLGQAMLFWKRAVSAFMIFVMMMGVFSFMSVDINVALADSFTVIEDVKGGVTVERDGQKQEAFPNMELREGDTISTSADGLVSIRFLDDSVSRLKGDSSINIKKLFEDPSNSALTNVEVEVNNGDVWSRVLNLFEGDSSFVVKVGDISASTKKAAFNVHKDGNEAVVEVYSNVIDMKASASHVDGKVKVKSGEKVVAKRNNRKTEVVSVSSGVAEDNWVKSNLEDDKVHIAKVEESKAEEMKDSVGVLPQTTMYSIKSLKTGVVKLLTFDDISGEKLDFETADRKFVEWTVLLKDGKANTDDAKKVFDEFVSEVSNFKDVIAEVRVSGDAKYADELNEYLDNKFSERKEGLKAVLPSSPLYVAKDYLFKAELASAEDDAEKALIEKDHATSQLSEAQDLAETGDQELAAKALDDYAETVVAVNENVQSLPESAKNEVAPVISSAMEQDKDMLSSIQTQDAVVSGGDATSLVESDATTLDTKVSAVKEVVDPLAKGLQEDAAAATIAASKAATKTETSPETTATTNVISENVVPIPKPVVSLPVQHEVEYGVTVSGSGDNEKPLDPLLGY